MAVSAEADRIQSQGDRNHPQADPQHSEINLLSLQQSNSQNHGWRRAIADTVGAGATIIGSRLPWMIAESAGICMGPYAKIAGKALSLTAGLIGGTAFNNVIAGRDTFASEGIVRNLGASMLGSVGLAKLPMMSPGTEILANGAKFAMLGAGYQGMNIGLGDFKEDGTKYTTGEALGSMGYAGLATGLMGMFGIGTGVMVKDVAFANQVYLATAPFAVTDFHDIREWQSGSTTTKNSF